MRYKGPRSRRHVSRGPRFQSLRHSRRLRAGWATGFGTGHHLLLSLARAAAVLLLAPPADAALAAAGDPVQAVRREGRISIDGRLDEPAWSAAVAYDGFVQRFPDEGAAPSEPTTVRVLFDDRILYLGVSCQDSHPELVQRPLGRRDNPPFGDSITVAIDSVHDGQNAFVFSVTAAGVLSDGLLSYDDEYSADWDAVWEGAAAAAADGWSVELAIPLAALRFQDHGQPVFGFGVKRVLGRTHEEDFSFVAPRNARGQIRQLSPLIGLSGLSAAGDRELSPYAALRLGWFPEHADDALRPRPRLVALSADLGIDLKTSLGRGLSLQGAVNPDFGQVEADQVVQNLSTYENQFPEKRPFFTQGMDLFRSVYLQNKPSPQQMFYSRRIGLSTPILAAVKLSGAATDQLQVGVVEAFVSGESAGSDEDHPEHRYRFSASQPLWFGPRDALPQLSPPSENFLAALARWQPDPRVSLGATVTSGLLTGPRCTAAESHIDDDDLRPERCNAVAGNAAALDFSLRTRDGEWFLRGQASGSQAMGGSPLRTLPDGTQIRRGDLGYGAHAALGRAGGEPWRFELHWEYESPRLDLNPVGFQRTQNEQVERALLRYVRPGGSGPFHSYDLVGLLERRVTTDGRRLQRGGQLYLGSEFQLRSFDWFGAEVAYDFPRWDVREIDQAGVDAFQIGAPLAYARPGDVYGDLWLSSDNSRRVVLEAGAGAGSTLRQQGIAPVTFWWAGGKLTLRPHPRLESRLEVAYEQNAWPARWVEDSGAGDPRSRQMLFADLSAPDLSIIVREQLVLTPQLTLQAYAQLFTTYGRYSRFRLAHPQGGRVRLGDLGPTLDRPDQEVDFWDNPDFRSGTLNVNVVLRWEYRLGSLLYLVYTRSQAELGYSDTPHDPSPTASLRPVKLGIGPTVETMLLKWSYWWSG